MRLYTDIAPYCCEVLRARVADGGLPPGDVWCRDIRTITADELRPYRQVHLFAGIGASPLGCKLAGLPDDIPLITGGWPCQDISDAGLRTGISGTRSGLYRELVRCLRVVPHAYGLLENVAALLRRGMDVVLGEVAGLGRDAEWDCLSAASCGLPHLRRRVWIVVFPANASGVRPQGFRPSAKEQRTREQLEGLVQTELRVSVPAGAIGGVADGVPRRMDRLSGLGNSQVPQVVAVVARAIMAAHEGRAAA